MVSRASQGAKSVPTRQGGIGDVARRISEKSVERIGINLMPEEEAIALLGVLFQRGKEEFLASVQKQGFPREVGEQELRKLLLCVSEEALLSDPHFLLSLYMGALSVMNRVAKALGRDLKEGEGTAAIKIALDDIFQPALARKLFLHLAKHHQLFSRLTTEEFEVKLKERQERLEKLFPEARAENTARRNDTGLRITGTDTWLVPCPKCGAEKRCDARTKRFKCKCGLEKPYDGEHRRIVDST